MDLESVIQKEVSQKNKYLIITHMYGIQENGVDEPVCRAEIDTDIENRLVDTVREGQGRTNWGSNIDLYGLHKWHNGKESASQCRRHIFDPWEDPLEEEMATYSSILAWEIPRTEEPGALQSMGLQRVRHDIATKQQQ